MPAPTHDRKMVWLSRSGRTLRQQGEAGSGGGVGWGGGENGPARRPRRAALHFICSDLHWIPAAQHCTATPTHAPPRGGALT